MFGPSKEDPDIFVGVVNVAIQPGFTIFIDDGTQPWELSAPEPEETIMYNESLRARAFESNDEARRSQDSVGVYYGADGQKVLSVRMNDYCRHDPSKWERKACGHQWCSMCAGYVDESTRVALSSPGPIITCNRNPATLGDYEY